MNIKSFGHKANKWTKQHSPEILVGVGIAGFISTVIMVAKEAPKAKEKLDDLHHKLGESEEPMTKPQIIFKEVKTVAPIYAPAVATGILSTGCILASYNVSTKRAAAWATACEIAQTNLIEFKDKVATEVGEKTVKKITHYIVQDHLDKSPEPEEIDNGSEVVMTGKSLYCIDYNSRHFYATRDDVWKAVKRISDRLQSGEDWISLNELLWELDIRRLSKEGDSVGFNSTDGINIIFDSGLAPNGEPCGVIIFEDDPMPEKY